MLVRVSRIGERHDRSRDTASGARTDAEGVPRRDAGVGALATRFDEPGIWGCSVSISPSRSANPESLQNGMAPTQTLRAHAMGGRSTDTGHNGTPRNLQEGDRWTLDPRPGVTTAPAEAKVPRNVSLTVWLVKGGPSPKSLFASRHLHPLVCRCRILLRTNPDGKPDRHRGWSWQSGRPPRKEWCGDMRRGSAHAWAARTPARQLPHRSAGAVPERGTPCGTGSSRPAARHSSGW